MGQIIIFTLELKLPRVNGKAEYFCVLNWYNFQIKVSFVTCILEKHSYIASFSTTATHEYTRTYIDTQTSYDRPQQLASDPPIVKRYRQAEYSYNRSTYTRPNSMYTASEPPYFLLFSFRQIATTIYHLKMCHPYIHC